MCFSPEASFIASGGLATMGAASLAIAPQKKRILAYFPLVFALQQLFEGIQWMSIRSGNVSLSAGYGFLFFALLLWPTAMPLCVYFLDEKRRPLTKWFLGAGMVMSLGFTFILVTQGIAISEQGTHIHYEFANPLGYSELLLLAYLCVTAGPLVFSTINFLRWFGVLGLFSATIAYLFFTLTLVSVWCFFAAILSSLIVIHLYLERRKAIVC